MNSSELTDERRRFHDEIAPVLAHGACPGATPAASGSARFARFDTEQGVMLVAGAQEARASDLALAYGLTWREDRPLLLVLPAGYEFPTLQRASLLPGAKIRIWTHPVPVGGTATTDPDPVAIPTPEEAQDALRQAVAQPSPRAELAKAAGALHLGFANAHLFPLLEWATRHRELDSGHRRDVRAWHCRGQRVLSLRKAAGGGIVVRAGIHGSGDHTPHQLDLSSGTALTDDDLKKVQAAVEEGIERRLSPDGAYRLADEHWLQSVIRSDPSLVGIEQPALRELPAWRPVADPERRWGRGFIDLVGLDGHGDIRIVETKLAVNADPLFILQGLDYYVWATVYRDALIERLSADQHARVHLHYVLGTSGSGPSDPSPYAAAQAHALGFSWRFQTVDRWYPKPDAPVGIMPSGRLLEEGQIPHSAGA